jgi:D-glycero-alpha-D-manno-heptose 1-phosphate guanylyltransferase
MYEGIILAGGFGTRLQKAVADLPKPMAPIAGRPFLEIVLRYLARQGFGRVVLSLGYMSDTIISHFGDHFSGLEIAYVVEKSPLGTGGAVRLAMEECSSDHVYIFNGDTFLALDTEKVDRQWQDNRRPIIVGRYVSDTNRYGRLVTDQNKVIGFEEKGLDGPGLINAGCYVLNKGQLDHCPLYRPFSLETDYFARKVAVLPFDLFVTTEQFIDIGVPEEYERAQTELKPFLMASD